MTDIVERLREYGRDSTFVNGQSMIEAADEIERLRLQLRDSLQAEEHAQKQWDTVERDNERLRGLLQRHYELRGKPAREEWVDGGPTYRLAMQLWRDTAAALAGAAVQPTLTCAEFEAKYPHSEPVNWPEMYSAPNQPNDATDAARYRWLRERINWRDVDESGGAFSRDPLKYQARHWTHSDVRLPSSRPASEHIDEYIDAQLTAVSADGATP